MSTVTHNLPKGYTFTVAGITWVITDYNICQTGSYYVRPTCQNGRVRVWDMGED